VGQVLDVFLEIVVLRCTVEHLQGNEVLLVILDLLADEHTIERRIGCHGLKARQLADR
jgi:hypothetical protein